MMNIVRAAAGALGSRTDRLIILFALAASGAALGFLPHLAGWPVAVIIATLIAVGGAFWLRSGSEAKRGTPAEIGRLLMFGVAASLPSLLIAHSIDRRQAALEDAFKARQRSEDLQLQVSFQGNLAGVNLSGRNLSRFQLPGRNLNGAHLEGATLSGANLAGAQLVGARLDGAKLDGVNLTYANLRDASFAGADLERAKLYSAHLEKACFASGSDAHGRLTSTNLRGAHFAGGYVSGTTFAGANLEQALFTEDLRDARGIAKAIFVNANVRHAQFPQPVDARHQAFRPRTVPIAPLPSDTHEDSVVSVSDGDTLRLKSFGKAELVGEDAPTVTDPSGWGARAQRFVRRALPPGTTVRYTAVLHRNRTGHLVPEQDGFGRKSIYLWRVSSNDDGRGRLFNQEIVAEGYARARAAFVAQQPTRIKHRTADRFLARDIIASQERARQAAFHVWSACVGPDPVQPFALRSP